MDPPRLEPDPAIDELWSEVHASWEDDAAHAAFLERCRLLGKLPQAAARYRQELADEGRRALAEQRLRRITALALLEIEASRSAEPPPDLQLAHKLTRGAIVLFFLGALLVLAFVLAR